MVRNVLLSTITFFTFVGVIQPVNASDLPVRQAAAPPPILSPVPVYNWTGIYIGINGGYAFGTQDPLSLISDNYSSFNYTANGWLFGGTFGAQIQSGHVVLGIEADIDWTDIKGSGTGPVSFLGTAGTGTLSSSFSSVSTLRTRVGYAQDNWLFFGTFGLAAVYGSSSFSQGVGILCNTATTPSCNSKSALHAGLAAGAGVEYGITPNWSAKLEYIWMGAGAGNTMYENMARAGLNYRFGGN
jgi:outer membrane immunogenic protein